MPLDTFVAYGQWFQAEFVPDLEQTLVSGITPRDGGFELELENGDTLSARQVVVAVGVEHFPYLPKQFAELPGEV